MCFVVLVRLTFVAQILYSNSIWLPCFYIGSGPKQSAHTVAYDSSGTCVGIFPAACLLFGLNHSRSGAGESWFPCKTVFRSSWETHRFHATTPLLPALCGICLVSVSPSNTYCGDICGSACPCSCTLTDSFALRRVSGTGCLDRASATTFNWPFLYEILKSYCCNSKAHVAILLEKLLMLVSHFSRS